jgi:hypothetical protein
LENERKDILDGRNTLLMEGSPTHKVWVFEVTDNPNFKQWYDPYKGGRTYNLRNNS